jgi:hypothetical protein
MSNDLIEENVYRVQCVSAEVGESSQKHTPYVRCVLRIVDGSHAKRQYVKDLYLTDKAWEKAVESMRAMGWTGDDVTDLTGITDKIAVAKIGQELVLDRDNAVKLDPAGKPIYRNTVFWIGKENVVKPLDVDSKTALRDLMRARMGVQPKAADAAPKSDDDLPF